jgi:6-phosphofructokinase 1
MRKIGVVTAGDSALIVDQISKRTAYEVQLNVLGHALRGGPPTAQSRILANQFGAYAVDLLLKGEKKALVGIKEQEMASMDLAKSLEGQRSSIRIFIN